MSDLVEFGAVPHVEWMPPAQARAKAVEVIARAFYRLEADDVLATTGEVLPAWERAEQLGMTHRACGDARTAVDALLAAEIGLRAEAVTPDA